MSTRHFKKAVVGIVAFMTIVSPSLILAQEPIEEWVRKYDSGGGGDWATAHALDPSGNLYVTGASYGDYATIKYDPNGNELWVRRYGGQPSALSVDAFGNAYVTGISYDSYSGYDFATVKYDTNGNELWVKRYDNAYWESPISLAVDSLGNVYVTGISIGSSGGYDYTIIKYDANGHELWLKWYDGGLWWDYPTALAVDLSGNIYVTGYSDSASGALDFATVKYDTSGNELWVKRYDGGYEDSPSALAVDSSGNVYVTGESEDGGGWYDYATIKYDTNGNEQWFQKYDAGYGYEDRAKALAVDASGNVYVTGASDDMNRIADIVTIKYASNGNELWVKRHDSGGSDARPSAMVGDSSGNTYITGIIQPFNKPTDAVTMKYDTNGNELWVKKYDGGSADTSSDIALDPLGNVYVTGASLTDIGFYDYLTIKYNQHPTTVDYIRKTITDLSGAIFMGPGNQQNALLDKLSNAITAMQIVPSDASLALSEMNDFYTILCNMKKQGKIDASTYSLLYEDYTNIVKSLGEIPRPAC